MFFSTSPLPFCRQLINTKQSGDIEVAKKFKRREIDSDAGEIQHRGVGVGTNAGGNLLSDEELDAVIQANAKGAFSHVRKNLDKDPNYYNKKKKKSNIAKGSPLADRKRNPKAPKPSQLGGRSRKMDGGKIYASTDKKYGGGIYPRKPTNG